MFTPFCLMLFLLWIWKLAQLYKLENIYHLKRTSLERVPLVQNELTKSWYSQKESTQFILKLELLFSEPGLTSFNSVLRRDRYENWNDGNTNDKNRWKHGCQISKTILIDITTNKHLFNSSIKMPNSIINT